MWYQVQWYHIVYESDWFIISPQLQDLIVIMDVIDQFQYFLHQVKDEIARIKMKQLTLKKIQMMQFWMQIERIYVFVIYHARNITYIVTSCVADVTIVAAFGVVVQRCLVDGIFCARIVGVLVLFCSKYALLTVVVSSRTVVALFGW